MDSTQCILGLPTLLTSGLIALAESGLNEACLLWKSEVKQKLWIIADNRSVRADYRSLFVETRSVLPNNVSKQAVPKPMCLNKLAQTNAPNQKMPKRQPISM